MSTQHSTMSWQVIPLMLYRSSSYCLLLLFIFQSAEITKSSYFVCIFFFLTFILSGPSNSWHVFTVITISYLCWFSLSELKKNTAAVLALCSYTVYINFFASEIHRKVSSKEVVRGSISAVSLNNTRAETTEESKPCCRNIWSQDPQEKKGRGQVSSLPQVTPGCDAAMQQPEMPL